MWFNIKGWFILGVLPDCFHSTLLFLFSSPKWRLCFRVRRSWNQSPTDPFRSNHSSYIQKRVLVDVLDSAQQILVHYCDALRVRDTGNLCEVDLVHYQIIILTKSKHSISHIVHSISHIVKIYHPLTEALLLASNLASDMLFFLFFK